MFFFWNGRQTTPRAALKSCRSYGTYALRLRKRLAGSLQVTELLVCHMSNNLRPILHRNRDFCRLTYCYWLGWRHAWLKADEDRIWLLALHRLDPSNAKVTNIDCPIPTYLPIVAKIAIYGGPRVSGSDSMFYFHTYPFLGSPRPPPVNQGHWRSLQPGDFFGEGGAVLFRNAIRDNQRVITIELDKVQCRIVSRKL